MSGSPLAWRWLAVAAGVAMLLHARAVTIGFAGDDYVHLAMLAGIYPGEHGAFDLFVFFRPDAAERAEHLAFGTAPWWTVEGFHGSVLRPLASALIWLDHRAFLLDPAAHHLHSLLWWGLAVAAVGLLLRRVLSPAAAFLGLGLFALDDAASLPVCWLANRGALVSTAFTALALAAHVRWRERGGRTGPALEGGAWALGLSAGEYALSGLGFVLAWELAHRHGRRSMLAGLLPAALAAALYMSLHRGLGYGTIGSAVYVDPFVEPWEYVAWAASRIPRLLAELFAGLPANTGELTTRLGTGWAFGVRDPASLDEVRRASVLLASLLCALSAGGFAVARRHLDPGERRCAAWLLAGAILGLFPVAAAPAHGRLLLVPGIGAAGALALGLLAAFRAARGAPTRLGRLTGIAAAGPLLLVHAAVEPWWAFSEAPAFRRAHDRIAQACDNPALAQRDLGGRRVIVVAAAEPTTGIHGALVRHARGHPPPRSWQVLSMTSRPHVLQRVAPATLELSPVGGPMLADPPERFFRPADRPLRVGDTATAGGLTATVLAADQRGVTRVRFDFDADLDDPAFVLLLAGDSGLRPLAVPAVGESLPIPPPRVPGLPPPALR